LIKSFTNRIVIIFGVPLILVNLFNLYNTTKREGMNNLYTQEKKQNNIASSKIDSDVALNSSLDSDVFSGTELIGEMFENNRVKRSKGYEIDYASTIENAYGELNQLLGSEGIQKLTGDTQRLMKQQLQLAESMKNITPVIESITPLLEKAKGSMGGLKHSNQ
jgi:hypothetical protein